VKIAIFGGTFDPVHLGHIEAAAAAAQEFRLDKVLFIPTGRPPHKISGRLTEFHHRFAMVALACAENPRFVPCPIEAPDANGSLNYSINTARAVKRMLGPRDHLYFLTGVDAFLDLPHWRNFRGLLNLVDFIITSRPGFDSREIQSVAPRDLLAGRQTHPKAKQIPLRKTTLHVLRGVEVPVASRDIREAVREKRAIRGQVPPLVEQYILKEGLYRPGKQLLGGQ